MQLSEHFSLDELIQSNTGSRLGINNTPNEETLFNLNFLASKLESVRSILNNKNMIINSGYRCPDLNRVIGGTVNSQHCLGQAADFICPDFGSPIEVCQELLKRKDLLNYDQLIFEFTWVHISFVNKDPRKMELTYNSNHKYETGILET